MMTTTIEYLEPSGDRKTLLVRDEQYEFHTQLDGIVVRPWATAIQFIPAGRILSMFTTGIDPEALPELRPLKDVR